MPSHRSGAAPGPPQPCATIVHNTPILAFLPLAALAALAIYLASEAVLHSYILSQRFTLRNSPVTVQEIAPPWVTTDLIGRTNDPRAMPLDASIAERMEKLVDDDEEVIVEPVKAIRDDAGAGEHKLIHDFNATLIAQPMPA